MKTYISRPDPIILAVLLAAFTGCKTMTAEQHKDEALKNASFNNYQPTPKHLEACIKSSTKAIKKKPDYYEPHYWRGFCRFLKKEYDLALSDLNKSIQILPKENWGYYWRARAYQEMQKWDSAISDYNRAMNTNPEYSRNPEVESHKDVYAHYFRGYCYWQKTRFDEAIEDFSRQIELTPRHEWTYYFRALSYKPKGDTAQAAADLQEALKINPNFQQAQSELSALRQSVQEPAPAQGGRTGTMQQILQELQEEEE